jgi:hypothetical protein
VNEIKIHSVTAHDGSETTVGGELALYELQRPMVEPLLQMFRLTNTALDVLFYDVGAFAAAMHDRGAVVAGIDTGGCGAGRGFGINAQGKLGKPRWEF